MKRRTVALCTLAVLTLSACAGAPPPADLAADEQAIRTISARWLELDRAGDAAAIAQLFSDDGTLYREAAEPVVGASAIQAFLTQEFAGSAGRVIDWSADRVEVAATGDMAAEYGHWTESRPEGAATVEDHGRYMTTYRKVGGEWKIVADMSLSTKPAMPATGGN